MEVSAVFQRPSGVLGYARRSMSVTVLRVMGPSAGDLQLNSAVEAIAEITESGDDVFVIVETTIDDRSVDRDLGIMLLDRSDPFRSRDNTHDADPRRSRLA